MTRRKGIGKTGMTLAVIIMAAMCCAALFFGPTARVSGETGICLPSPNLWNIPPVWSWAANTLLLGLIAAGAFLLNRHHNFIRSTEPVLPAMFLVLAASTPWTDTYLSTSTILCAVNLVAISILFPAFKSRNATQEMFVIATLLSLGSMIQYAFLPFIVAYVIGAILMKAFRIKEMLATLMGLVAPYWVGVGLGLIPPDWFRMPDITNLFSGFAQAQDLFVLMLSAGLAIFAGIILGLNNSIKLYAGNSRINALNMTITLVGMVSIICVIVDFTNMMAYLATLYFTLAVQIGNLCALWTFRREWLVAAVPAAVYVALFLVMLLT
jgi:hypothetical protein